MKIILFIWFSITPLKSVNNDKITVIISKMGTFNQLIEAYQKQPLNRGENRNSKAKRIRLMKRKVFVLEYNLLSRNIDINKMY